MKDFKINNCRFCNSVFCCKSCREKHEKLAHKIVLDCDICLFGKLFVSSLSERLMEHLKAKHWPLHCIFCKRIFGTVRELIQHKKCPIGRTSTILENTSSPNIQITSDYDSPPFPSLFQRYTNDNLKYMSSLVTSTPMQSENNLMKKIQEVLITPVDSSGSAKGSIIKKNHLESSISSIPKRRVTFSTPYSDQNISENDENKLNTGIITPSATESSSGTYYSAIEEPSQEHPMFIEDKGTPTLPPTKRVEEAKTEDENEAQNESLGEAAQEPEILPEENKTLYISAISNITVQEDKPQENVLVGTQLHSFIAFQGGENLKKKLVSVVAPQVVNEESLKIDRPTPMSSTPNSTSVPVRFSPIQNIFRPDFDKPSTSQFTLECSSALLAQDTYRLKENNCSRNQLSLHESSTSFNHSDTSLQNRFWTTFSKIIENVTSALRFSNMKSISIQNASCSRSFKRSLSDSTDEPDAKRYRLARIKCRPPIRELPPLQWPSNIHISLVNNVVSKNSKDGKTYVDKASQTELSYPVTFSNIF